MPKNVEISNFEQLLKHILRSLGGGGGGGKFNSVGLDHSGSQPFIFPTHLQVFHLRYRVWGLHGSCGGACPCRQRHCRVCEGGGEVAAKGVCHVSLPYRTHRKVHGFYESWLDLFFFYCNTLQPILIV